MTNPYYTATGLPAFLTRGVSSSERNEYSLIQTGFDGVNTAISTKGSTAGQVWTGTQDFTGANILVPTKAYGSSGAYAVSVDMLNTAVFASANFPAQTGNAGKLTTTNGTTISWSGLLNTSVIRFSDSTDLTKLLAFSTAGITSGTTRTLTAPDKSGTIATLADSMSLLAVITPTAAAAVNALNVFSALYDSYIIYGEGIVPASDTNLSVLMAVAGVLDGASNFAVGSFAGTTGATGSISINISNTVYASGTGSNFVIEVLNANSSGVKTVITIASCQASGTPTYASASSIATYVGGVVTGLGFTFNNGGTNFKAQGSIRIYGVQKA